nr:hypothetical protein [Tanacetum cinerariifolium]
KFDGEADEGFFVGYSLNSKAIKGFNSRTRIVEENLHTRFSESTPNVVGNGPDWLFDIDALTRRMNYELIIVGLQSNNFTGTKASNNVRQARKETEPIKDYIFISLWTPDPPFFQYPKSSHNDGSKPSSDDEKKVDEDLRKESERKYQEKEDNVNSTKNVNNVGNVNTVSLTVNAAGTNEVNVIGEIISSELSFDPDMRTLEDVGIFNLSSDHENDGSMADIKNLDTTIQVSHIPTTRIHKDHSLDQVIGDLQSAIQTRKMLKNLEEHGLLVEPKKGNSCIKRSKLDKGYAERASTIPVTRSLDLVDLPNEKRAIGSKWVFKNKKDERGIVIRNKARLVAQGYTQEEGLTMMNYVPLLFKNVSKQSNDSLLARGNTLPSDEDRMKLDELMALYGEEVFVLGKNENIIEEVVDAAQVSTATTTVTITTKEITLAQTLEALKTLKPKKKVEDDKEKAKLKQLMETIPYKEEVAIDAIPLAVKEDLKDLYKFVKARYGSTRPVESMDYLLWSDMKLMFEPHVEYEVWKLQKGYKVLEWKLYDSCGVHSLMMQSMQIYMLVEKKYPLTLLTLSMMLEKKLQIDYESEMAYQLCKLIKKQLKK